MASGNSVQKIRLCSAPVRTKAQSYVLTPIGSAGPVAWKLQLVAPSRCTSTVCKLTLAADQRSSLSTMDPSPIIR